MGTIIKDMDQEEQRYVREGFSSDEELSLYDMLFSENLSKQDIQKIKKVAVDLLEKVKAKITELDHWTDKQETKANGSGAPRGKSRAYSGDNICTAHRQRIRCRPLRKQPGAGMEDSTAGNTENEGHGHTLTGGADRRKG